MRNSFDLGLILVMEAERSDWQSSLYHNHHGQSALIVVSLHSC